MSEAESDFLKQMAGVYEAQRGAQLAEGQRVLQSLLFQYQSTLTQFPALGQELNQAVAALDTLDVKTLLARLEPALAQASELGLDINLLTPQQRKSPELANFLAHLPQQLVMANVGLLAKKFSQLQANANAAPAAPHFIEPEMVELPRGRFLMGSPSNEPDRHDSEGPQHEVTINYRLAVGKYPVTFAEWDTYAAAEKGVHRPEDCGWGRGNRPVIDVSWQDAQGYLFWLRKVTGKPYRLLSEAEWEYACRAGTTTAYSTGQTITSLQANFDQALGKTTEVGSYPPNPFGLYDMHGNVWEWVEDVWHDSYQGAPTDGSAWLISGEQNRRVLRGGSWYFYPRYLRSAYRLFDYTPVDRSFGNGFRIAMTLP